MGGQTIVVELNTWIMAGLLGFGVGVIVTGIVVMLVVIYNNIKVVTEKVSEDDSEENVYGGIPLSALLGGGGGRPISMADLQAMASRAAPAPAPAPATETKQTDGGGNYL
jgi:hypothetical protein